MSTTDIDPLNADIRLFGQVNDAMFQSFSEQLAEARKKNGPRHPLQLELTTTGGNADTGRRIANDIRICRDHEQRPFRFVGHTTVYSAGITIMAAFPVRERFLVRGTELLIHERHTTKTITLSGALRSSMALLRDELAALESGHRLECEGFDQLVEGSTLSADDVLKKVLHADWYLSAEEAVKAGLAAGVIRCA